MAERESIHLAIDVNPLQTEAVQVDFADFIDFAANFSSIRFSSNELSSPSSLGILPGLIASSSVHSSLFGVFLLTDVR
jgi:hypothetical protein